VAPNAFANGYNPDTGASVGAFSPNNFSDPEAFLCGAIGGIENATAPETAVARDQDALQAAKGLIINSARSDKAQLPVDVALHGGGFWALEGTAHGPVVHCTVAQDEAETAARRLARPVL
jgi:hypothetical protein